MANILVISAHQNLNHSTSNRLILDELEQGLGSQVSIRRLSELYPDFNIDVSAEQQALLEADVVVLQYPIFWYNPPAILKKWLDDVWTYGFAYGEGGDKLKGKKLLVSTTTGGVKEVYSDEVMGKMDDLLKPMKSSAIYASFEWLEPEVSYAQLYIPNVHTEADLANVQANAKAHAARVIAKLANL
ncbi:potassium transporter [Bibersteinia trehalosi Y31]|uniref:Potassium transporter n=1 Tax=Bibersteinia trehalosi Y31 TaxID=1261658 RepID=A0A179CVK2_BIBTR|nr:NAD(P)H-dependent oxidoreductase [Bibersteinia trehalosi]OAQ13915.1 potassium transporter [Bibersteinia trehalosi Y31]